MFASVAIATYLYGGLFIVPAYLHVMKSLPINIIGFLILAVDNIPLLDQELMVHQFHLSLVLAYQLVYRNNLLEIIFWSFLYSK